MLRKQLIINQYYSYDIAPGASTFTIIGKFTHFNVNNRPMILPEFVVFHNDDSPVNMEKWTKEKMVKAIKEWKKYWTKNNEIVIDDLRGMENYNHAFFEDNFKDLCKGLKDFYKSWDTTYNVKKEDILNKVKTL